MLRLGRDRLAVRLRDLGFSVVEHPGWQTRGYKGRDLATVAGVVWHHTGTPRRATSDYPTANYIMTGGAYPPWAQLGVGYSGAVHLLAAGHANHAGQGSWSGLRGNADCIGVEVESPGGANDLTPAQVLTVRRLARALTVLYAPTKDRHIRHADWAPTRKVDIRGMTTRQIADAARDASLLSGPVPPPAVNPPKPPTPAPPEDDMFSTESLLEALRDPAVREQIAHAVWAVRDIDAGTEGLQSPELVLRQTRLGNRMILDDQRAAHADLRSQITRMGEALATVLADELTGRLVVGSGTSDRTATQAACEAAVRKVLGETATPRA